MLFVTSSHCPEYPPLNTHKLMLLLCCGGIVLGKVIWALCKNSSLVLMAIQSRTCMEKSIQEPSKSHPDRPYLSESFSIKPNNPIHFTFGRIRTKSKQFLLNIFRQVSKWSIRELLTRNKTVDDTIKSVLGAAHFSNYNQKNTRVISTPNKVS